MMARKKRSALQRVKNLIVEEPAAVPEPSGDENLGAASNHSRSTTPSQDDSHPSTTREQAPLQESAAVPEPIGDKNPDLDAVSNHSGSATPSQEDSTVREQALVHVGSRRQRAESGDHSEADDALTATKRRRTYLPECSRWIRQTSPCEPSFCFIYWKAGTQEIVWEGPDHMQVFMGSEGITEAFKRAVLTRPIYSKKKEEKSQEEHTPISLRYKDPKSYRNDVLAKIIPRILNPSGRRNFYHSINRPRWFPSDVTFRRPNHPKDGEKRMQAVEMRKILQAFVDSCPDQYIIEGDNSSDDLSSDGNEDLHNIGDLSEGIKDNSRGSELLEPLEDDNTSNPEAALRWCNSSPDIETLKQRVLHADSKLNVGQIVNSGRQHGTSDISNRLIDWRRKHLLSESLPHGFVPFISSSDGNCLFSSVSLILFGDTTHAVELRFAALLHAVQHMAHYLEMLNQEIESIEDALQFFATVTTSDVPCDVSDREELLKDAIQTEIFSTSKIDSYSGLLQILFSAGATKFSIAQHTEVRRDGYNTTVFPCTCLDSTKGTIHIMWVKSSREAKYLNHIIPLIPDPDAVHDDSRQSAEDNTAFLKESVKYQSVCKFCKDHPCLTVTDSKSDSESLVKCDRCHAWLHCHCVGISSKKFSAKNKFYCCREVRPEDDLKIVECCTENRKSVLYVSDIQTLYPKQGVSDAVINFFVRELLPEDATNFVAGALSYTAIVSVCNSCSNADTELKRKFLNTNGVMNTSHPILLFPCRTVAFVLDSSSPSMLLPYSLQAIEHIQLLLRCWYSKINLHPIAYPVPSQHNGYDCGVHVMLNIRTLVKHPPEALIQNRLDLESFGMPSDCDFFRKELLKECFIRNTKVRNRRINDADVKKRWMERIQRKLEFQEISQDLKVVDVPDKGKGVVTLISVAKDDLICEYCGDLVTYQEAKHREERYLEEYDDSEYQGYMFFFNYSGNKFCIDATVDNKNRPGRFINHSKQHNIKPKLVVLDDKPRILFFATRDIHKGEELLYDYNDRSKEAVLAHPWLST